MGPLPRIFWSGPSLIFPRYFLQRGSLRSCEGGHYREFVSGEDIQYFFKVCRFLTFLGPGGYLSSLWGYPLAAGFDRSCFFSILDLILEPLGGPCEPRLAPCGVQCPSFDGLGLPFGVFFPHPSAHRGFKWILGGEKV